MMIQENWFNKATIHPFWMGVISLIVSAYGVLFLGWTLEPVIFLLWFEIIYALGAAMIRSLFSLQGQSFFNGLISRIVTTGFGAVMGIGMIMLTVAFTIKGIDTEKGTGPGASFFPQIVILFLNYLAALLLHFFLNGRYKTASPIGELMSTFLHILLLLCLIMPITMHLLPKYPEYNNAKWVGLSVLLIKFLVDSAYSRISNKVAQIPVDNPPDAR
jgi:hypothetical protein